jgi:hypothetical protein
MGKFGWFKMLSHKPSSNQINADKKRFWLGKIQSIDSKILNESMHASINHFNKNEI